MARPTRVALALGAGGARGYAHIGVIEVLEERGYEIVSIAGTSMGAVVGGLHAAGQLEGYTQWVRGLTQREVLRLLDPTLRAPGAIRAERILAKVSELLGGAVIEALPVPFTAVATDLLAGKEVWFQHGPVDAAIRAAIALPSFISPVILHGRLLADGGLLNPVPVAATAAAAADLTVAVALSDVHRSAANAAPVQESAHPPSSLDRFDRPRRSVAQLLDGELRHTLANLFSGGRDAAVIEEDARAAASEAADASQAGAVDPADPSDTADTADTADASVAAPPAGLRTLDVMQLSLEAMQSAVTRYRLAAYPPDLLITIPRTSARTLDFHRAEELIALGRQQAIDALDRQAPLAT